MSFDQHKAQAMVGKYVLVGVNRCDTDGAVVSTEQIHGKVLHASEDDGLVILLNNGNEFSLPPFLNCYQPAEEGIYVLKSTNEKINNPDYIATFNVTATQDDE
ncbi:hypothetical protein [Pseudomonas leptonychotis]|uniref:hypothetical protein n=1 Tax=Pseudomonas leptonychotis TaxID=2448482 RepID=UPI0039EE3754